MKSWKTTIAGVLTATGAICVALVAMLDDNSATIADWGNVVALISIAYGLIMARDNSVTSKKAGAK